MRAFIYGSVPSSRQPSKIFNNADSVLAPCRGHDNQTMHRWKKRGLRSDIETQGGQRAEREQTSLCHFLHLSWDRPSLLIWPCSVSITLCFYICAQPDVKVCHYFLPTSSPLFSVFTCVITLSVPTPHLGQCDSECCPHAFPVSPFFTQLPVLSLTTILFYDEFYDWWKDIKTDEISPHLLLSTVLFDLFCILFFSFSLCFLCGQMSLAFIPPLFRFSFLSLCVVTLISAVTILPL